MAKKSNPFNPTKYLETDADIAAYIAEAALAGNINPAPLEKVLASKSPARRARIKAEAKQLIDEDRRK